MNYSTEIIYQGALRTEAAHLQSGNRIITDAPTDNHGRGEAISPTDLVAASLASCMLTVMGIKAEDLGINISDTRAQVEKIMGSAPRRIIEIKIHIIFNCKIDQLNFVKLKQAALNCPVAKSLHPDLTQTISFTFKT